MTLHEQEFRTVPPIEIERNGIRLRELRAEDAEAIFDLIDFDREHLSQTYSNMRDTTADEILSVADARKMIEYPARDNMLMFGIWEGNTVVGKIELALKTYNTAFIGFWVGGEHTGHSYATRAVERLSDYGFTELGYKSIYAWVLNGNYASAATLLKAGYNYARALKLPANNSLVLEFELAAPETENT